MPAQIKNGNLIDADTVLRTLSADGYLVSGLDISKAATPAVGQIYVAIDTLAMYICYVAGVWVSIASGSGVIAGMAAAKLYAWKTLR